MSDDLEFLKRLEATIRERLATGDETSYTARLAADGPARIAQKVGEEGVELALASVSGSSEETLAEAADLLYHLLVLLGARGLTLADVVRVLEARHRD
ncbi:MAG: phosphoribosyl-ATP diphosphatase [Woeseiaceae bacterium]|nr:phosphoribosyl-ATP diphosphatase [Woeseiaceae bacterium]